MTDKDILILLVKQAMKIEQLENDLKTARESSAYWLDRALKQKDGVPFDV